MIDGSSLANAAGRKIIMTILTVAMGVALFAICATVVVMAAL